MSSGSIFDTNALVTLAQRNDFDMLRSAPTPRLVPEEVDAEMRRGASKYPSQYAAYAGALRSGLLTIVPFAVGSPEFTAFQNLRSSRTNPRKNRGEDACIALASCRPGTVIYIDDESAARKARNTLGDPTRVRSLSVLLWA